MQVQRATSKKTNYIIALCVMLMMSAIFVNSFYWPNNELSKRKLVMWLLVAFAVVVVPIVVVRINWLNHILSQFIQSVKNTGICRVRQWKKVCCVVGFYALASLAAPLANLFLIKFFGYETNPYRLYLFLTIAYIALTVWLLRKTVVKRPEVLFLAVVLLVGGLCIKVSPPIVGVSWDDEIHYYNTLNISNALNGVMYAADQKIIDEYADNIYAHSCYDRESKSAYVEELNGLYEEKIVYERFFNKFGVWTMAYTPGAIGITLARGLNFSWEHTFMMGRVFNLLTYAIFFYYAIKKIKYGKMLLACIGLIPTSIFMATSYSYDYWVVSCLTFGFAYFFSVIQEKDKQISTKDMLIMVAAFTFGCLPKAIYFPLLFPILFIGKSFFKDKKQHRILCALVVAGGFLLVASFLLPMLIAGPGTGDLRGGADINSAEQIKFILGNPLQYSGILLNFLKDYLALRNASGYLQMFAYMGTGQYFVILLVTLWVVAFGNKCSEKEDNTWIRLTGMFAICVTLVLVPTALYISFTAVGSETIHGCQYRYILPLLFPSMYFICNTGRQKAICQASTVIVPLLIFAGVFLGNLATLCVKLY